VWIPDEAQEALRDLTRAREDMKHLQRQAKQRLLSFLSRHGHRYTGRSRWTQAHWRWLEGIKFARPEQQIVLQEYIDTVQACGKRVASLDREVETAAHASPVWPAIEALMALRGVSLLAAVTVVAELGDLARFAGPPELMAYLGPGAQRTLQRQARAPRCHHQDRQQPCPAGTRRSSVDLSPCCTKDRDPAAARRAYGSRDPRDRLVGAKAVVSAVSKLDGTRQAQEPSLYRHCARTRWLYLGYRATCCSPQASLAAHEQVEPATGCLGQDQATVGEPSLLH
jgi:hypothetical protein